MIGTTIQLQHFNGLSGVHCKVIAEKSKSLGRCGAYHRWFVVETVRAYGRFVEGTKLRAEAYQIRAIEPIVA